MVDRLPEKPTYTAQEVEMAVSSRRERIAGLRQQILDDSTLEATLLPQVSTLLTEIGHYQEHEVKDKE